MQMALFFIFVVDFVAFVVVSVTSELGYGVSSFAEPNITRRCRMSQETLHRRKSRRTRRQRRRCRLEGKGGTIATQGEAGITKEGISCKPYVEA